MVCKYGKIPPKLVVNLPGNVCAILAGKESKETRSYGTKQQKRLGHR